MLGTTREGKSKLLEQFIRHDINNGFGATLLDPSDNGQTAYDILRYCQSIGFDKVCLIDPHDANNCLPSINPLRWRGAAASDSIVANLMESIRHLWGQTNFNETPRIETYLRAIFAALYATGNPKNGNPLNCGIPDAINFSIKEHKTLHYRRLQILDFLHPLDKSRMTLEEIFNAKGQQLFLSEFRPTVRRLEPFFGYLPKMLYGATEHALDFRKLVSEKWVVLVNLDKKRLWGTPEQRLLGTLVVNEIVSAISDLRHNGWSGQHYLYIDEAGQFATRGLSDIMAYQGKSGLWATLSHQFYGQFEDKQVLEAVENLCKIKVMFYTPNVQDRQRMLRDMYTGDLKLAASDAHFSLQKQHAVIKVGKQPPATVRIADVPDVKVSPEDLGRFKEEKIYKANPWYRSPSVIREEINNRFAIQPNSGAAIKQPTRHQQETPARAPAPADNKPKTTPVAQNDAQPDQPKDTSSTAGGSIFDAIADSANVLQHKKGRPNSKRKAPPAKTRRRI